MAFIGDIKPMSSSLGGAPVTDQRKDFMHFILVKYGALWDSLNEQRQGVTHERMGVLKPTASQITHSNRVLTYGKSIPGAADSLQGLQTATPAVITAFLALGKRL